MRVTGAFVFGLGVVALGLSPLAATAQKEDAKKDGPFQGVWAVVKLEFQGKDVSEALADVAPTMTFDGNTYHFKAGDDSEKGTFTLDPKAKTPTIDLMITEGRGKGKAQLGIYKLDGDTLKVCLGNEGAKERPTKFATAEDSPEHAMFTLKRKAK